MVCLLDMLEKLSVLLRYLNHCSTSNSGFVIIRGLPEVRISDYRTNKFNLRTVLAFFGQRLQRGQSPVKQRELLFVCPLVCPPRPSQA